MQENNRNVRFIRFILFTDEATFTRSGFTNVHNIHVWAEENPHAVIVIHNQVNFMANVWAGIIDNFVLGTVFLPHNLNGE